MAEVEAVAVLVAAGDVECVDTGSDPKGRLVWVQGDTWGLLSMMQGDKHEHVGEGCGGVFSLWRFSDLEQGWSWVFSSLSEMEVLMMCSNT